jgi:hypothetical protein
VFKIIFWGSALVQPAFQRIVNKSAGKIFGEADTRIIFATRFEKKAMFFAG